MQSSGGAAAKWPAARGGAAVAPDDMIRSAETSWQAE
jgi:hypothetical protein